MLCVCWREGGREGSFFVLLSTFLLLLLCRILVEPTHSLWTQRFPVIRVFLCSQNCRRRRRCRSWVKTSLRDKLVDTIMTLFTPSDRHSRKCFSLSPRDSTGNAVKSLTLPLKRVLRRSTLVSMKIV